VPEFSIRDAQVVGCRAVPLSTETGVAMAFDESAADTTTRPERCRMSVKTALRNTALSDLADEGRQADTEVAFTRAEAVPGPRADARLDGAVHSPKEVSMNRYG